MQVSALKTPHIIQKNEELKIACKDGNIRILELQIEGKRRMTTSDFLKGFNIDDVIRLF